MKKNLQQCAKNNANFISRQLLFPHRHTHTHVITDYLVTGFLLSFCSTTSKEAVDSWQTVSASAATAQQLPSPSCYVVMLILQCCCDVCVALLCFSLRDFLLCPWRLNVITALYTSECSKQWTVTLICHFHLVSFLAACKSLADALTRTLTVQLSFWLSMEMSAAQCWNRKPSCPARPSP